MVDSESLTELSGTNSSRVALGVWMVGSALAGLAGVLIAPTGALSIGGMTLLMVTAFAPVVAARLRSLPIAVLIALAMGVVTDVVQRYLPADSTLTVAIVPSIPFGFILLFLLYYLIRGGSVSREAVRGGALDAAIRPPAGERPAAVAAMTAGSRGLLPLLALVFVAVLPLLLTSQYWLGLLAQGWPPLLAAVVGGLLMAPIGALTVRLGDLYVELVTLSFGLLAQTLIVTRPSFYQFGAAVGVARPEFATDERVFAYVALGFFLLVGLVIVNLRRSTTGLGVSAVRWSEPAACTLGLSVGLVWIAVLVTIGGRGGGGEGRGAPPVPRVRGWLGTVASWVHCGQGRKR